MFPICTELILGHGYWNKKKLDEVFVYKSICVQVFECSSKDESIFATKQVAHYVGCLLLLIDELQYRMAGNIGGNYIVRFHGKIIGFC